MIRRSVKAVLAGGVCLLASSGSWSQEQNAGAADSSTLGEVLVTAQKRSENLQNVPLSITAVGSTELEQIDSANLVDFARRIPGLSFRSTGPGENDIVIRGIGSASSALRQTTGYYLDETPLSAVGLSSIDAGLFGLERIEVLRGPQGTLYGSGSMGGTVRLITSKPNLAAFSARGSVSVADTRGGALSENLNAEVNLPLNDKLAARVVGYVRNDGGWIERARRAVDMDPTDPSTYRADPSSPPEQDVNAQETKGIRMALGYQPTENLSITPSVFYQRIFMDARADYDQPPGSADNQLQTRLVAENIEDSFTLSNVTAKYNLRAVELMSSTSYFDRERVDLEDISPVSLFFFQGPGIQDTLIPGPYTTTGKNHAFVEELRVSTTGAGPFRVIGGAFYSDSTSNTGTLSQGPGFSDITGFPIVDDIYSRSQTRTNTKEKALFGEVSYTLMETLTFTAGVRRFDIDTFSLGTRGGFAVDPPPAPPPYGDIEVVVPRINLNETGTTQKYMVSWQATPSALVYASGSEGFRPGSVNGPFPDAFCGADLAALGLSKPPETFDADSLWNYEVGGKTRWLDNRLTVNGSVYYIDWKGIQQQVALPCGFEFLGNFGSARSRGAELEVTARVLDRLVLSTGIGYNKAELTGGAAIAGVDGEPGDPLQNAPEWTINASADYTFPVKTSTGGVTLNYQYSDEVFGSYTPTNPDYRRPGFGTVQLNGRIEAGKYEYSVFVNNLTDAKGQTAFAGSAALDIPGVRVVVPIRPRTIGFKVAVRF